MSDKFESIHRGLVKHLPKWVDIMIFIVVVPYFQLDEFLHIDAAKGKTVGRILRMHGLIETRDDRRFKVSFEGKRFAKWATGKGLISHEDGTDFAMAYGEWLGRRIQYEALFLEVPKQGDPEAGEAST